jgi:IS30 family transposase
MRGPEVPLWKRHSAITYRSQQSMSYHQIGKHLKVKKDTIKRIIQRAKKRAKSLSIEDLQEAVVVQPRAGRDKRVESGDTVSQAVRDSVQIHEDHALDLAANYHLTKRQALSEIDANIKPLANQQVHNILHSKEHYEKDPHQQRALIRKRMCNRNALSPHKIDERLQYCYQIEHLYLTSTMIICVDKKGYDFRGTPNHHVTAPEGVQRFQPTTPIRFRVEQWAAACGDDCSITRP